MLMRRGVLVFRALVLLGINCGGEGILTADSHILL